MTARLTSRCRLPRRLVPGEVALTTDRPHICADGAACLKRTTYAPRDHCRFPPCGLPRSGVQEFPQLLPHGFDFREATSDGPRPIDEPGGPRRLPLHRLVTSHRECPGPAALARLAAPPHAGSHPPQSVSRRYTAHVRRGGHHDRDSVPVPVVPASLVSTFVVLLSLFSCYMRWLYITDFDHQSSLEGITCVLR